MKRKIKINEIMQKICDKMRKICDRICDHLFLPVSERSDTMGIPSLFQKLVKAKRPQL